MTLGETIRSIRLAKGMSQGDLADALDVSRQSVSKWETDASVPELDKLVKMCGLFGVTMDELVRGGKEDTGSEEIPGDEVRTEECPPEPQPEPIREEPPKISTRQHITGIILLCTSAVILLMLTAMGAFLGGLIFASPFLACGVICVTQPRLVGLKCSWAIYFLVDAYLSYATGVSRGWVITVLRTLYYGTFDEYIRYTNPITAALSVIMLLAVIGLIIWTTAVLYRKPFRLLPRLITHAAILIFAYIGNHYSAKLLMNGSLHFNELNITLGRFFSFVCGWLQIVSVTGLLCVLFAFLYRRKHN